MTTENRSTVDDLSSPPPRRSSAKRSRARRRPISSKDRPTMGWRSWMTNVLERLGLQKLEISPSKQELNQRRRQSKIVELWQLVDQTSNMTVAVFNFKGGAGKTPIVAYLSCLLAEVTGVPVAFCDGNPGSISPGFRMGMYGGENLPNWAMGSPPIPGMYRRTATMLELYRAIRVVETNGENKVERFDGLKNAGQLLNLMRQNHHGVNVLVAEHNVAAANERFSAKMASTVLGSVIAHNRFVFIDTGNDYTSPAQETLADLATDLVFPAYVQKRESLNDLPHTLSVLASEHSDKTDLSTVVFTGISPKQKLEGFSKHLGSFTKPDVIGVPYDEVIEFEPTVRLDLLNETTKEALLDVLLAVFKQHHKLYG